MTKTPTLELLRQLREAVVRAHELKLADLDRRIKELERARPASQARQRTGRGHEHQHALLKAMQQAPEPLPPREIARRLDTTPKTASRWLAAARRRGYVERVGDGRYAVVREVPQL